jgi:hypothetical protein
MWHVNEDVLLMLWTKIHRIPSTKSGNNDRSTTSGPTSSPWSIHLAPATGAAEDKNEGQRHAEKLILPEVKNIEKTKRKGETRDGSRKRDVFLAPGCVQSFVE